MDVYILIREDQNDHGFVDTSISGVFATHESALAWMKTETREGAIGGLACRTRTTTESYEGGGLAGVLEG